MLPPRSKRPVGQALAATCLDGRRGWRDAQRVRGSSRVAGAEDQPVPPPGIVAERVDAGCVDAGPHHAQRLAMNEHDVRRVQSVHEYEFTDRGAVAVLIDHRPIFPWAMSTTPVESG